MTLRELIEAKSKKLQDIPDKFLSEVEKSQRDIFNEIISLLDRLKKKEGRIDVSEENFKVVAKITEDLRKVVLGSEYVSAVKGFATEFNTLKNINDQYFKKAFPDISIPDIANEVLKQTKKQTVSYLLSSSLNADFLRPLEKTLTDAVASNAGFSETLKQIRNFVEGNEEVDGAILRYSKQIAHDSFAIADRSYSNVVANDLQSPWRLWDGPKVLDSRCFCLNRKGKFFHVKEIEAWGRGENIGGGCGFPWAGMNRNTNSSTIFSLAGGHGCLDSIVVVSIAIVPMADIQRNIANGNFLPSKFEKMELELA